jgi:hypothetical protein
MEVAMFEQIMRASEAAAAHRAISDIAPVLTPALWGCAPCDMTSMIASPLWRNCTRCGASLTIVRSEQAASTTRRH